MRHKIYMELEFDSDDMGFEDWKNCEGFSPLEAMKEMAREEGLFGTINVTNSEIADSIVRIEEV